MLHIAALCLMGSVVGDYTTSVQDALTAAAPKWLRQNRAAVARAAKAPAVGAVEVAIDPQGRAVGLSLAHSSGDNAVDDLLRAFILDAEPLPPPGPADLTHGGRAVCLVRGELQKRQLETAVACFASNATVPQVAGLTAEASDAQDAAARLFAGWVAERAGNAAGAEALYAQATAAAPQWDYAARAHGLLLVQAKRYQDAMPLLRVYIESRQAPTDVSTFAHELKRFAEYQQAQEAPRKRLSKSDLAEGIQGGFDHLEPCLEKARKDRRLALGEDTLVMSWKIRKDGSVYGARLQGPKGLVMTGHGECLERAVEAWRFRPFTDGDELAVNKLPIKVRGASPQDLAPPPSTQVASSRLPEMKASISACQRDQREIMTFVSQHMRALNSCVQQERKRMPHATMPDKLPIRLVVEGRGTVRGVQVSHRHYRTGPLSSCVQQALAGRLAEVGGADCPAQFDLDLRGL